MAVKVRIPTPLQKLTNNEAEVQSEGATLKDVIDHLEKKYPGFKDRICDETGKIRRFVNIYVNEEDVRFQKGEATVLKDGDDVSIIPAIAGGLATFCGEPGRPARFERVAGGHTRKRGTGDA